MQSKREEEKDDKEKERKQRGRIQILGREEERTRNKVSDRSYCR
jgi:hypothetical protein